MNIKVKAIRTDSREEMVEAARSMFESYIQDNYLLLVLALRAGEIQSLLNNASKNKKEILEKLDSLSELNEKTTAEEALKNCTIRNTLGEYKDSIVGLFWIIWKTSATSNVLITGPVLAQALASLPAPSLGRCFVEEGVRQNILVSLLTSIKLEPLGVVEKQVMKEVFKSIPSLS